MASLYDYIMAPFTVINFIIGVPIIFISWLLSRHGKAKADPIAPAPIITIFFINYTYLKTNIANIEEINVATQRLKSVRPSQAR